MTKFVDVFEVGTRSNDAAGLVFRITSALEFIWERAPEFEQAFEGVEISDGLVVGVRGDVPPWILEELKLETGPPTLLEIAEHTLSLQCFCQDIQLTPEEYKILSLQVEKGFAAIDEMAAANHAEQTIASKKEDQEIRDARQRSYEIRDRIRLERLEIENAPIERRPIDFNSLRQTDRDAAMNANARARSMLHRPKYKNDGLHRTALERSLAATSPYKDCAEPRYWARRAVEMALDTHMLFVNRRDLITLPSMRG